MPFRKYITAISIRIVLIVVSLIAALALGELLTRIVFHRSMDFDMEMWKYATQIKVASDDPEVGHEHRSNRSALLMGVEVAVNDFGLRDEDLPLEKATDTYRIVMLGDSTTLGWGVPQEDTFSAILERRLQAQPPEGCPQGARYEVLNLGVGNYNTGQEVARLRNLGLRFQPDLILLNYFINDAEATPRPQPNFLLEHSYLYALALSRLRAWARASDAAYSYEEYYRSLYEPDQPGWQDTMHALSELAGISRSEGIPTAIVIIPELHDLSDSYPFQDIQDKVKEFAESLGFRVADLTPEFHGHNPEEALWVSPADAHPNAVAQTMIANAIYERLICGTRVLRAETSSS